MRGDAGPDERLSGHVAHSQPVDALPDAVFTLASQVERLPRWHPFFIEVRDASGPLASRGARFDAIIKLAGQRLDVHYEVVEARAPDLLVLVGTFPGGRLSWARSFELEGARTIVRGTLDYDLPASFAPTEAERVFAAWAVERDVRHSLEYFCEEVAVWARSRTPDGDEPPSVIQNRGDPAGRGP